ncbi:hypothetical protein [Micromonospora chokoriensis]|uniref:Uncharacterized protein n=1 Tax=Micromonospora chokoriensis TaxID=356851 RepID=A0A1C4XXL8_9ACTN|nr:hypothetical protein [Micromonospora chokoriensis]SCF13210.1 hypothetical protein GA0070612_4063 [Micromonospora chokoriensis]
MGAEQRAQHHRPARLAWQAWAARLAWADTVAWAARLAWADTVAWAARLAWADTVAWAARLAWADTVAWAARLAWAVRVVPLAWAGHPDRPPSIFCWPG